MTSVIPRGYVVLGRIGAAQGLRGEVRINVRTDDESRLAAGQGVLTDDPAVGELTVARLRYQGAVAVISFEQVTDRNDAEAMRGLQLIAPAIEEDDAWYPEDLVGLNALSRDGRVLGTVVAIEVMPAHDVLVIKEPSGARTQVPFVTAIVPEVNVEAGHVVLEAPVGLLLDEPGEPDVSE